MRCATVDAQFDNRTRLLPCSRAMLSIIPRLIVGATFAIGVAAAQAQSDVLVDRYGPYLLIAGGANQYDYDC